ncbi:hypothetical protein C1646_740501 [Rhizophagus diaphanus]|nr:hypothetical protein C1646_740501 [Rhizophagus diaphanus] [Rhizophagus sp. MUCL 43196]
MKFISYDRFKNIEFIKAGGFSKFYKATWIDGPHSWNEEKEDFEYEDPNIIVALKQLNNSENISIEELKEVYIELMQECWNSDPIKRPEAANISKKLCNILNEEVSNPTEIIKSTDIAPIDNPKSKQSSNEPFTISSKKLDSKASDYIMEGVLSQECKIRQLQKLNVIIISLFYLPDSKASELCGGRGPHTE